MPRSASPDFATPGSYHDCVKRRDLPQKQTLLKMPRRVKKFRRSDVNIFHFGKTDRLVASLPSISEGRALFWPVYVNFGDQGGRRAHTTAMGKTGIKARFKPW